MKSLNIAVIGSGISGLSAAWLLSKQHNVTVFEKEHRIGGHTNTVKMDVDGKSVPVDTGFICFNDATYPNLIALFDHLNVPISKANMSFAASMNSGRYEYAGGTWLGMVGQPANVFKAGHWRMMRDIIRFFKNAEAELKTISDDETLEQYLVREGYSREFRDNHLLPMAAAIWSSKLQDMTQYPAKAFMRFFHNHGLTKMYFRPQWRSVLGGSNEYVKRIVDDASFVVDSGTPVTRIDRDSSGVTVYHGDNLEARFDHVVIGSHADEALSMLATPSERERELLGSFSYANNLAVLHRDRRYMPKRKLTWGAWNYINWSGKRGAANDTPPELCVSYWMNILQKLTLQGTNRTWYCGAHFGAGFHEDGLQSGLAVAEQLGGMRRPWDVANESGRIFISNPEDLKIAAE